MIYSVHFLLITLCTLVLQCTSFIRTFCCYSNSLPKLACIFVMLGKQTHTSQTKYIHGPDSNRMNFRFWKKDVPLCNRTKGEKSIILFLFPKFCLLYKQSRIHRDNKRTILFSLIVGDICIDNDGQRFSAIICV